MKSFRAIFLFGILIAFPLTWVIATETSTDSDSSELNNPNPQSCGIYLTLPDYLCRNNDDDQDLTSEYYEQWDLDHVPSPGDDDLKVVTVTGTAGPTGGTMTLEITAGSDKINDIFWKDSQKNEQEYQLSWEVEPNASRTETLYIEGYDHSAEKNDVKMKATMDCPAGTGSDGKEYSAASDESTAETTVYEVDLDVDSENDNAFDFAGFTDAEDKIETSDKEVDGFPRPGKIAAPTSHKNSDDDDLPDYADGFNLSGAEPLTEPATVAEDLKFIPVQIKLKEPFDPESSTAIIEFPPESVPSIGEGLQVFGEGTESSPKLIGVSKGGIRLWRKKPESRTSGEHVPEGDLVPMGQEVNWSDLTEEGGDSRISKLYLEYVDVTPFQLKGKKDIKVTIKDEDVQCEDKVKAMFAPVDTDVDSDNNSVKEEPQRTPEEEGAQYGDKASEVAHERPGKLIYVNSGDEDYDGIPDFADGFSDLFEENGIKMDSGEDDGSDGFVAQSSRMVPLIFDFPEMAYPDENLIVRFEYEDSDPHDIEKTDPAGQRVKYELPDEGTLRLWSKDCRTEEDGLRSIKPVLEEGHFVKADTDMNMSELRPKLKTSSSGGYVLYVESVKKSEEIRDQKVTIKVGIAGGGESGEAKWIYDETVHFTSVEMNLVAIDENGETQRTASYGLSHSSPVITLTQNQVSAPKYNYSQSRWEVDITVAGTIKSDFLDTVPEEQGGVIDEVFVHLNNSDEPIEGGTITVQVSKVPDPSSMTKPFPYSGSFVETIEGVPVPDGKNIISVRTRDQVFRADGVVASSFTAELPSDPPPPPTDVDEDGDGIPDPPTGTVGTVVGVVTQHTLELLDGVSGGVVNHLNYSVSATGAPTSLVNYQETGIGTYVFADPEPRTHTLELQENLTLDAEKRDTISAVFRDNEGNPYAAVLLYETGVNTNTFIATFTEWIVVGGGGGGGGDPVNITDPVIFYETDGGEFHPYAYELEGPRELITKFELMKFTDPSPRLAAGSAEVEFETKIKEANDKMFLANKEYKDSLGIVAFRENLDEDQFPTVSDTIYAAIAKLQTGSLYPQDKGKFVKGFGMGLVKGGVEMVGGLGEVVKLGCKAVYEGGKAVIRAQVFQLKCIWKLATGQTLDQEVRQMTDASEALTKKFDYFETIKTEGLDAISAILEGKFERLDRLSGAMKDLVSMGAELFAGIAEAVAGNDDYEKGIFWGRTTFEVASSYFPVAKLGAVSKLKFLDKAKELKFFKEGPGLAAYEKARKLHELLPTTKMCFVAGTPVWTSRGSMPIESVKVGDLVWSRADDDVGRLALKAVVGTIVTHPASLVEIQLDEDSDGQADETLHGTPEHPFWVEELQEFVPMGELLPGNSIRLINGTSCSILTSSTLRGPPGPGYTTYNFEVESFHTYFVGSIGVWVHNSYAKMCEDFEARITHRLGERPRQGNRFEVLKEELTSRTIIRNADVDHDMNMAIYIDARAELGHVAAGEISYDKVWDYNKQRELKKGAKLSDGDPNPQFSRVYAAGFEIHHLSEKRISRALGVPEGKVDSSPAINLPRSKDKMSGDFEEEYAKKFDKEKPVYHQGPGGLVEKIDQIFTELGYPPKSSPLNLLPNEKKSMIDKLKKLYTLEEPAKHLNAWPATRDWLEANVDDLDIKAYLALDPPVLD